MKKGQQMKSNLPQLITVILIFIKCDHQIHVAAYQLTTRDVPRTMLTPLSQGVKCLSKDAFIKTVVE